MAEHGRSFLHGRCDAVFKRGLARQLTFSGRRRTPRPRLVALKGMCLVTQHALARTGRVTRSSAQQAKGRGDAGRRPGGAVPPPRREGLKKAVGAIPHVARVQGLHRQGRSNREVWNREPETAWQYVRSCGRGRGGAARAGSSGGRRQVACRRGGTRLPRSNADRTCG